MKSTVTIRCDDSIKERYNELYPYTLSRFLNKCLKLAISNKDWFIDIYFKEIK